MLYLLFKSEIYYTKGHSKQQNLLTKTPTVTPCACFVDTGVLFDKEAFVLFPLSFPPPPPPLSLFVSLPPSLRIQVWPWGTLPPHPWDPTPLSLQSACQPGSISPRTAEGAGLTRPHTISPPRAPPLLASMAITHR